MVLKFCTVQIYDSLSYDQNNLYKLCHHSVANPILPYPTVYQLLKLVSVAFYITLCDKNATGKAETHH